MKEFQLLKYLLILLIAIAGIFILLHPGGLFRSLKPLKLNNNTIAPNVDNSQGSEQSSTVPSSASIALGVYVPAADPLSHGTAVDQYTKEVGKKPAFAWFSVKWKGAKTGDYTQFDPRLLDQFRTRGIMPGITWDASKGPALNKLGGDQPEFSWKAIASGKHDAYITEVAKSAAEYRHPFFLRTLHEMNGNWYPWGYSTNGNNNPADFVSAWKHIVDIFRREGATNVQFVWCPAAGILTPQRLNQYGDVFKAMYPGDDYVDWIGLDGYSNLAEGNRSLENVFFFTYEFLTDFTNRPMMIYEVGATENPSDSITKANWIKKGFLTTIPTKFPEVKIVNYFNSTNDGPNAKNYALDTSENALNAWKQVVSNPLYQGNLIK